jgi:multicomponent Na+:H+ antiporter subunit A
MTPLLLAVAAGFAASIAAPWLNKWLPPRIACGLLVLVPAGLFIYFLDLAGPVGSGEVLSASQDWIPRLGIFVSFYVDGLSILFALLITGIGALVFLYGGGYLAGDRNIGRFYAFILLFMSSMVGLVLADNLILLFVFWELTSISSYFLIGYYHDRAESRAAALQSLLVTGGGGLALLVGFLLLGLVGGSYEISTLLQKGKELQSSPLYLPLLLLILAGAFTKSAQFPFHFWLPDAMQAPSPVSAFLHSATMVKAGIYLLARLSPILGGTAEWHYLLSLAGATTMLAGVILALGQNDLKRILAYTTVSALGMLVLLIGLDTVSSMEAAFVFLFAHALYKGALFLVAGTIDHETGTRDIRLLGGLRRIMPITAVAALLAALSMAGLPPLLGFIGKELLYEAKLQAPSAGAFLTGAGILTNVLFASLAMRIVTAPFLGRLKETPDRPSEPGASLWLGPLVLALLGLLFGMYPEWLGRVLISPAVNATRAETTATELGLWHGFNPVLALSLFTLSAGLIVYLFLARLLKIGAPLEGLKRWGPARWYAAAMNLLITAATVCTGFLQNGRLSRYLRTFVVVTVILVGYPLIQVLSRGSGISMTGVLIHEVLIAATILLAAIAAVLSSSRLAAVAALGVVGFGMALLFIFFGAPDLAMTQFAIEGLTVVLFVLVIYKLPQFGKLSSARVRLGDLLVAVGAGVLMSLLTLAVLQQPLDPVLAPYYAANSLALGHGRNVVNVILVDFRALDTLGEITVLAVAGLGGFALLRLRLSKRDPR